MRWLHGLLYHCHQVLTQLVQVHLVAQRCTERWHDLGGVIFAAVEATINDPLKTMAQGLEQSRDGQGGDDDGHTAVLADDAPQQRLQANHQANVDYRQDERERTIHQRAVDQTIYIIERVTENRNPNTDG